MFTCIHLYLIYLGLNYSFNIHISFSYGSGMIMNEVYLRKLTNKNLAKITSVEELSYSIRNVVLDTSREIFRRIERNLMKFTSVTSHLMYKETCFNNQLLPIYTNIYICIYIYMEQSQTLLIRIYACVIWRIFMLCLPSHILIRSHVIYTFPQNSRSYILRNFSFTVWQTKL